VGVCPSVQSWTIICVWVCAHLFNAGLLYVWVCVVMQEFLADPNVFALNRECAAQAWEMYKAWDPATGASHPGEVCFTVVFRCAAAPSSGHVYVRGVFKRPCVLVRGEGSLVAGASLSTLGDVCGVFFVCAPSSVSIRAALPHPSLPVCVRAQAKLTPSSITIGTRNIKFDVFSTLPSSL
jgi:hypothetical protein